MAQPTLQDIKGGLDPTGLTTLNASQIFQITDTSNVADDKGLVVETIDSAADTPIVPDAVTNTKWKRYIWKRRSFNDATAVKMYNWDENHASVATFLRWVELNADSQALAADVQTALDDSGEALAQSNTALSNSATALVIAQESQTRLNLLEALVTDLAAVVNSLQLQITTGIFRAGDLRHSAAATVFSTTEDEGWLECNGASVSKTTFSSLWNEIGYTYGGSGDSFNVPDFRGRTLLGAGTGTLLSPRVLGEQTIGAEDTVLPAHTHALTTIGKCDISGITTALDNGGLDQVLGAAGAIENLTDSEGVSPTGTNMQPSAVSRILIKT